jgi:Tfp pilus assembly protein PilZ
MSEQRRRDNRVDVDWVARVGKRGIGVAKGQVQNASISGIYVETTLVLSTGDHVLLELQVDIDENSRPILCEALIARRTENSQRRNFGYGMQFTRIDDEALQKILSLITELWSAQQPSS